MSTVNKIKYYLYAGTAILGAAAMAVLVLWKACTDPPAAAKTIGVSSLDYPEETQAAMDVWNGFVGCSFLVPGDDIIVKGDEGAPCNDPFRPDDEWGHAATAYKCGDKFEIHLSYPGTNHTAAHEIAHEIGHVLGRPHQVRGVMGKTPDPNSGNVALRISDSDVKAIKKDFCK